MTNEKALPYLINDFIRDIEHQYSAPTIAAYTQALNVFMQFLRTEKKLSLSRVTVSSIEGEWGEAFMVWLQESRSVETEHLYMRAIYQFYQYVDQHSDRTFDIELLAHYIETNRRPKVHAIPTLPSEAIRRIVQFAEASRGLSEAASERELLGNLRDRAFILMLACTGLRISEICDLRISQFDVAMARLSLNEFTQLPLSSSAATATKTYLMKRLSLDQQQPTFQPKGLPLFSRHDKRVGSRILPISRWTGANIVEAWVRAALNPEERGQLEETSQVITPHSFRHHFVLNALMSTEHDVAETQVLARHSDRSTTRRYLNTLTRKSSSNS